MAKEYLETPEKCPKMIQKRHKTRLKTPKMDASEHHPFPATLRPTEKSRGAVLAALAMAPLLFSVGFGNISYLSMIEFHHTDKLVLRVSIRTNSLVIWHSIVLIFITHRIPSY